MYADSKKGKISGSPDVPESQEVIASESGKLCDACVCTWTCIMYKTYLGSKMNPRSFTDNFWNLSVSPLPARTKDGHAAKRGITGMFYV